MVQYVEAIIRVLISCQLIVGIYNKLARSYQLMPRQVAIVQALTLTTVFDMA